jgi:UDP-N-acetylglucosamine 2-epimerase (non-hydrolysing)
MTILVVFGTRPEAIKLAPVIFELQRCQAVRVLTCSTGQHHEMLKQVTDLFEIPIDHDLAVMHSDQTLASLSSLLLLAVDRLLAQIRPDLVLVQGDTTSTFIVSLCAFYRRIRVGHIEAGLRSGERYAPFPEEMNRVLTGRLADLHFAPTERAKKSLLAEGVSGAQIYVVGNTVIDALLWVVDRMQGKRLKPSDRRLLDLNFNKRIILVTAHRRESFGRPAEEILRAIARIAEDETLEVVFPVHLNPHIRGPAHNILGGRKNIHLLDPLAYADLVFIMSKAYLILTDSGGIQEEAPSLRKPVLVMRDVTERVEGVEHGVSRLVGTTSARIVSEVRTLCADSDQYKRMAIGHNPYGDGKSAGRIRTIIESLR